MATVDVSGTRAGRPNQSCPAVSWVAQQTWPLLLAQWPLERMMKLPPASLVSHSEAWGGIAHLSKLGHRLLLAAGDLSDGKCYEGPAGLK